MGKSLRFKSQGYKKDKFLLKISQNENVINKVLEMYNFNDHFHFIISNTQSKIPTLKSYLQNLYPNRKEGFLVSFVLNIHL